MCWCVGGFDRSVTVLDLRSRSRSTLRGWENLHLLDFTRLDLCRSASSNNNDNADDTHEDASWVFSCQDREATQKRRELDKAKEKQQEQLDKQKQIEKVKHSVTVK